MVREPREQPVDPTGFEKEKPSTAMKVSLVKGAVVLGERADAIASSGILGAVGAKRGDERSTKGLHVSITAVEGRCRI